MTPTTILQSLDLPEDVQEILTRFVANITQELNADLDGLLLFGSAARGDFIIGRSNINVLLIVQKLTSETLQCTGKLHREWGKHQIVAPLLMTKEDLMRSRDLFPLEFLQMSCSHVLLAGQDPFSETQVDIARLGWQSEQELMSNLLRVRQRFIEGEGRIEAIQALLILSITAVLPCIRGLLHCIDQPSTEKDPQILEALPTTVQFDSTVFLDILHIKRGLRSPGSREWAKTYERYRHSLEHFLKRIQEMRQEGRL